jgi:hypothetical protein
MSASGWAAGGLTRRVRPSCERHDMLSGAARDGKKEKHCRIAAKSQ